MAEVGAAVTLILPYVPGIVPIVAMVSPQVARVAPEILPVLPCVLWVGLGFLLSAADRDGPNWYFARLGEHRDGPPSGHACPGGYPVGLCEYRDAYPERTLAGRA